MSVESFLAVLGPVAAASAGIATAIYYLVKTLREKMPHGTDASNSEAHQLRQALADLHEKLTNALTARTAQVHEDSISLRERIAHLEFRLCEILAQSRETRAEGSSISDSNSRRRKSYFCRG